MEYKGVPISEDVARLLKRRRGPRSRLIHPRDLLTNEDIKDIMKRTRSPSVRAYLWCLYDTGTRPGALCNVDLSDLKQDSHGYVIDFKRTKTDASRRPVRLLIPEAISALDQWLAVHPDRLNPSAPLFLNRINQRFKPGLLTIYLKDYHQSRVGKNLNLYLFRKTRATSLLKEKRLSETEIKVRLGHEKDSQMLGKYYAILDEEDQAEAELQYLGIESKEEKQPQPVICPSCGAPNPAGINRCSRCLRPLTEIGLLEDQTSFVRTLAESGALQELVSEAVKEALTQSREPEPAQRQKRKRTPKPPS